MTGRERLDVVYIVLLAVLLTAAVWMFFNPLAPADFFLKESATHDYRTSL